MLRKIINYFKSLFNKCYYLGSTDILPPPLSKEEETKYIMESLNGNKDAKNILIEHNLRLVVYLAKKYENTGFDIEDLVSIGSIGLIKGINTYKPDKNIKLATYASRCIANEILMFLRKNKNKKAEVSFEDALNYDAEGNELHLEDIIGTKEDPVIKEFNDKEERMVLINEISKLTDRDKEIIALRYGLYNKKELTQKEVAEKLNISQSYISRIEKKVIKNIKQNIKA